MPVATFELPPPGAIRALMGASLTNRGVPNPPKIAHHPTGFEESPSDQGDLDAACQNVVPRHAGGPCARRLRPGRARPGRLRRVAERHRRRLLRERAGAGGGARAPARADRAPHPGSRRRRGAPAREHRALCAEDRRGAGNPPRRAGGGSTVARRARPCLARPRRAVPVAVRGRAGRSGSRGGGAGGRGLHDRGDRHRRRPRRAGSRREGAAHLQRPQAAGGRRRRQRPRHLRRGSRGRLVDERGRHRRRRGRGGLDGRAGGRCGRRLHGRRRGGRDRLRGRPRREDRQPQPRRHDDLLDREARGRLRGLEGRAPRRGSRKRLLPRERGRVSGRAPAAGRLEGRRRQRPLGRRVDARGRTRAVLDDRLARLARGAGCRRLQRRLLRLAGVALSAHDAAGRARRGLRLRQRHVVRVAAGRGCCRARVGREPAAPGCPGRVDPRADGVRTGQLERRARLRRPRRRCGGGEGTVDARGTVGPRAEELRRDRQPARSRRARSRRRARAGARRSARNRGRSRRRCRSSTSPRRRARRSAAPCRRGCRGSSAARRRAGRGR